MLHSGKKEYNKSSPRDYLGVYDFPNIIDKGLQYLSLPWERCEKTHSAFMRGMSSADDTGTFKCISGCGAAW